MSEMTGNPESEIRELLGLQEEEGGYEEDLETSAEGEEEGDELDVDLDEDEPGEDDDLEDTSEEEADDEEGDEEESEDSDEEEGSDEPDPLAELRAELAKLQEQVAQDRPFVELGRAAANQNWGRQPQEKEQQGLSDDVKQAVRLMSDGSKSQEEIRKELSLFPQEVQRKAVKAFRAAQDRYYEFALEPEKWIATNLAPLVERALYQRVQPIEQQLFWNNFMLQHREVLQSKSDLEFFAKKVEAGTSPQDAIDLLTAKKEKSSRSKREQKLKSKERDQRAQKRARRSSQSRRAGRRGKKKANLEGLLDPLEIFEELQRTQDLELPE